MTEPIRRLIGTIVLVVFLFVYFVAVIVVAASVLHSVGTALDILYWAVTGIVWAFPVAFIIKWMYRPDSAKPSAQATSSRRKPLNTANGVPDKNRSR